MANLRQLCPPEWEVCKRRKKVPQIVNAFWYIVSPHELKIFIPLQKTFHIIIRSQGIYEVAYLEEKMWKNWKAQSACFLFLLYFLRVMLLFRYSVLCLANNAWIFSRHKELCCPAWQPLTTSSYQAGEMRQPKVRCALSLKYTSRLEKYKMFHLYLYTFYMLKW